MPYCKRVLRQRLSSTYDDVALAGSGPKLHTLRISSVLASRSAPVCICLFVHPPSFELAGCH
jgi:hypothetical protein